MSDIDITEFDPYGMIDPFNIEELSQLHDTRDSMDDIFEPPLGPLIPLDPMLPAIPPPPDSDDGMDLPANPDIMPPQPPEDPLGPAPMDPGNAPPNPGGVPPPNPDGVPPNPDGVQPVQPIPDGGQPALPDPDGNQQIPQNLYVPYIPNFVPVPNAPQAPVHVPIQPAPIPQMPGMHRMQLPWTPGPGMSYAPQPYMPYTPNYSMPYTPMPLHPSYHSTTYNIGSDGRPLNVHAPTFQPIERFTAAGTITTAAASGPVPSVIPTSTVTSQSMHPIRSSSPIVTGGPSAPKRAKKPIAMPEMYDGKTSWLDYKSHFESCAIVNGWTELEKCDFLKTRLSGVARRTLKKVEERKGLTYGQLLKALDDRFEPKDREDLYLSQLRAKKKGSTEKLQDLGDTIRRLCELAYPTYDHDALERAGKHHFLEAITDEQLRHDISLSGAKTLSKTVQVALEREAFLEAEKTRFGAKPVRCVGTSDGDQSEVEKLRKELAATKNQLKQAKAKQGNSKNKQNDGKKTKQSASEWKKSQECYSCGKHGHFARECRSKTSKQNAKKQGNDSKPESKNAQVTTQQDATAEGE